MSITAGVSPAEWLVFVPAEAVVGAELGRHAAPPVTLGVCLMGAPAIDATDRLPYYSN